MIFVVLGILFYTYYVFVVRVCIPMIQLQFKALGTKSQGIIYITIFHILFVMFIWNYSVVVMTGPGYAKDYVHKSEPPMEDAELVEYFGQNLAEPQTFQDNNAQPESFSLESSHVQSQQQQQQDDLEDAVNETTGVLGPVVASVVDQITFPPQQARIQSANLNQTTIPLSPSQSQPSHSTLVANDVSEPTGFKPKIERSPIQKSVLTENYRYDYREGFLRPYRSHRCRHSGAVVLRLDHFCPYVGGSIGAKNHKYFINFVTWSTIFTGFVLISLLIISITHSSRIDGQIIAIIALSGFFTIFTFPLLVAHIRFALLNLTTIEDISNTRMRSRERAALNQLYGWNNFRVKKLTKQYWNQEWGRIGKEGNLWWLGSRKANWTMLMGENKLAWFRESRYHFVVFLIII